MTDPAQPRQTRPALSREQRLAAKLRENLRRRKAQARALDDGPPAGGACDGDGPADGPGGDGALSKPPASG
ncbi:MAG TPA: hypothetical protein VI199_05960 [Novosphingobium sp.]